MAEQPDPNMFVYPFQLTASMHRDVYPAVDPGNPDLSVAGKVVLITGASGLVGHVGDSHSLANSRGKKKHKLIP